MTVKPKTQTSIEVKIGRAIGLLVCLAWLVYTSVRNA
jgi:hypothetical protein